jgi:AcrR family transcriptional regulator
VKDATRHTIVTVAHHVFASRGISNTTMEDVAKASGLGRRTIYTYFKTREELLHAIIKKEIEIIIKQLNTIINLKISPEKKFSRIISVHMRTIQKLISKNKLLKMEFLKRNDRIEDYRKIIDLHEKECLTRIFREGAQTGIFKVEDYENTAGITLTTLKGLERHFILNNFGKSCQPLLKLWQNILFGGIKSPGKNPAF